jgi:hypothetical protein
MATTNIAAEGDAILTLQHLRLRVSSVNLSSASPVFKAMFGPDFIEGQAIRSAQHPKEVPLPEDDPTAMTRLCFWFHHKQAPEDTGSLDLSTVCGAKEFFSLVGLADKYGCMGFFKPVGIALLADFAHIPGSSFAPIEAMIYLITASYVLDDSRHFFRLTRYLVMDYETAYSEQLSHASLPLLPSFFLRE